MLGIPAKAILRKRDKAFRELGLRGDEEDSVLIEKMAEYPTLIQRPIGVNGNRAVVGRPITNLLEIV